MDEPTKSQPRGKRRPYRRQQILDAAVTLFAQRGYHATGMNDIGASVGISGPGIYRHFPSKEAILEAALEDAATSLLEKVQQIADSTPDPRERLERLVGHSVLNLIENHELYETAINERRMLSDKAQALFAQSQRQRVEEWASPLAECRPDLSPNEARYLVAVTQATMVASAHHHHALDPEGFADMLFNSALTILLPDDLAA